MRPATRSTRDRHRRDAHPERGPARGPHRRPVPRRRHLRPCLRAKGRPVTYTTCTDDSQSYVLTTARRPRHHPGGALPPAPPRHRGSLQAWASPWPGLPPIDEQLPPRRARTSSARCTSKAGSGADDAPALRRRSGGFLYDSLVTGLCPRCLASSSGGRLRELRAPEQLRRATRAALHIGPGRPGRLPGGQILVLPMEDYRERLTTYFAERAGRCAGTSRPLMRELLAGPLPELPITFPGSLGHRGPFAERRDRCLPLGGGHAGLDLRHRGRSPRPTRQRWHRRPDQAWLAERRRRTGLLPRLRQRLPLGPVRPGPADGARRPLRAPGQQRCQRVLRARGREVLHQPQPSNLEHRPARRRAARPGPVPPALTGPERSAHQLQHASCQVTDPALVEPWNALADLQSRRHPGRPRRPMLVSPGRTGTRDELLREVPRPATNWPTSARPEPRRSCWPAWTPPGHGRGVARRTACDRAWATCCCTCARCSPAPAPSSSTPPTAPAPPASRST